MAFIEQQNTEKIPKENGSVAMTADEMIKILPLEKLTRASYRNCFECRAALNNWCQEFGKSGKGSQDGAEREFRRTKRGCGTTQK